MAGMKFTFNAIIEDYEFCQNLSDDDLRIANLIARGSNLPEVAETLKIEHTDIVKTVLEVSQSFRRHAIQSRALAIKSERLAVNSPPQDCSIKSIQVSVDKELFRSAHALYDKP